MGNKALKITARYNIVEIVLTYPPLDSFESFKSHVKEKLNIPEALPIVIQNNKTFISTNYKWEGFTKTKIFEVLIWPQIETFVQSDPILSNFIPHLFKLQKKKSGKILSTGVYISKKICIIPSLDLEIDELEKLTKCKLVFFNEEELDLGIDSEFLLLGDQKSTQNFILIKHRKSFKHWNISISEKTEKIRGKLLFFNRKTKMISSVNTPYQYVPKDCSFRVQTDSQKFLPGAIFISGSMELIAIGRHKNSQILYPSSLVYSQIAEHLKQSIITSNQGVRKILSRIKGVSLDPQYSELNFEFKSLDKRSQKFEYSTSESK